MKEKDIEYYQNERFVICFDFFSHIRGVEPPLFLFFILRLII
jgi:hypothetical protein